MLKSTHGCCCAWASHTQVILRNVESELGEALTRWTVRLAIACYLGRVLLDIGVSRSRKTLAAYATARWLWIGGYARYVLHVLCAFAFFHDWSHQAAHQHTAEATARVTRNRMGWGIVRQLRVHHILAHRCYRIWWLRDVKFPCRSRAHLWTLHVVFAFIVFNATIVFGPTLWQWTALATGVVILAILACRLVRIRW